MSSILLGVFIGALLFGCKSKKRHSGRCRIKKGKHFDKSKIPPTPQPSTHSIKIKEGKE